MRYKCDSALSAWRLAVVVTVGRLAVGDTARKRTRLKNETPAILADGRGAVFNN